MKILSLFLFSISSASAFAQSSPAVTATAVSEKQFTMDEVAKHSAKDTCWFVVNGKVYDVTANIPKHPGGAKAIQNNCGKEASKAFETQGGKGKHSKKAHGYLEKSQIGILKTPVTP